ncbi:ABC transporter substrate-binding protein [Schumannella luteola]
MNSTPRRSLRALVPVLAVSVALTACTTPAEPAVDPDAPVTITVSNQPPASQAAELEAYLKVIEDFEAEHPNITVEGVETGWDPQTFQAQLAGGQLPNVMVVPFTEPQGLIARGQLADITAELEQVGLKDKLNPSASAVGQDADGNYYGVPVDAYALGLAYNRDIFEQAGLDPDNPPATWDEVREAAKTITEATGIPGYVQMTTGGQGGWMLTAMTYSAGGTVENEDGSAITITDEPKAMQEQLELLQAMRWEDNSMGSNFTYDQMGALKEFAAGRVGMVISAPVGYAFCTQLFGMDGDNFGLAPMPQGDEPGGSLSGGALHVVMPNTTPEQRLAAVEFIAFRLQTYLDEKSAVEAAKLSFDAGMPVGLPGLSPLTEDYRAQYLEWVADYINVPLENFATYEETVNTIPLRPEPPVKAQEVYAALDSVVQAVLTSQDTDIPSLLDTTQSNLEGLLSR